MWRRVDLRVSISSWAECRFFMMLCSSSICVGVGGFGYSKARGLEGCWSSFAPGLCYMLVGLQGKVSLWAQLVRVPRLCLVSGLS